MAQSFWDVLLTEVGYSRFPSAPETQSEEQATANKTTGGSEVGLDYMFRETHSVQPKIDNQVRGKMPRLTICV